MQINIGDRDGIYTSVPLLQQRHDTICLDSEATMRAFKDELDPRLTKYVKNQKSIAVSPKGT
jgi:hypothetical protein